jgi:polyisoprenoid-binding protein YceI
MSQTYKIDTAHSKVAFSVRHMVFAKVRGHFTKWSAELALDPSDLTKSSVSLSVDAASIDTGEAQRDGHLKSADFLDVEKFPKITYASRTVKRAGDKMYAVTGDLTIRGIAHEVTLDVEELGRGKDPWGNERIAFGARGAIDRSEYGLKWNQGLEAGGLLVGERVDFDIDIQVVTG